MAETSKSLSKVINIDTIDENFSFYETGSLKYIVDSAGNKVSDGYHEIIQYTTTSQDGKTSVRALTASRGSVTKILSVPMQSGQRFSEASKGYHTIEYRFDLDAFVGKLGSLAYILSDETGRELNSGHHTLYRDGDGNINGVLGSNTEQLELAEQSVKSCDTVLMPCAECDPSE